ncbi:hypothetical protein V1508DRAFT_356274 [Lipomyces doorenjongii]|uniref:uncharacterized protein n=1 Tax=Lipomyces doorenjongii TaxID=383834 RepID=UPI0034CD18FE
MVPAAKYGYSQPDAFIDNTRASFSTCWRSASSSLCVPVMEHGKHALAVNKNGHYICQQEPYELQQEIEQQSSTPPETQFSAAQHMHIMHKVAQPNTTNPPLSYSSAHSSVASSPLSSSQSEYSSPFDIDFDTFGLLDIADVTSMNSDIALGMCGTNIASMGSGDLGFQLTDECDNTLLDMPVDPLVSSATPFVFINSSNFEPEFALTSIASASDRLKPQHTSTLPALTPITTAPISTATPCPSMMAPGSDASVFLFAGEHESDRRSLEFLLHRTCSSDVSTVIQYSATIAPTLLSSSSSSTSTMYTPVDEAETRLLPSEEAVTALTVFAPTSFTSPASMATPDAVTSIFSTESRVSATDEGFCDFEENKQSRSILDAVENEKGRAVQEQLVLPNPTGPLDVLQRSAEQRVQGSDAARDESGRTNPVVCENATQPILIDESQSPVKGSKFAVIPPTTRPEKAKPIVAQFRRCEPADANSTRTKTRRSSSRRLRTPSSSMLVANTNAARSESFEGSTSRSPAPKRKKSAAGLDELSDLVPEPVVKYAAVDGPASSCSQKTCSFAIVIKAHGTDNSKTQSDSPRCRLHLRDPNKRQKLYAGLALAVGTLAVGLSATKIFA